MTKDNTETTVKANVAQIAGSLVSDTVLNAVTTANDKLVNQSTKLGELEGKLEVSKLKNDRLKDELKDSEKSVTIIVKADSSRNAYDYLGYRDLLNSAEIKSTFTKNVSDLEDLANTVVKKDAAKEVKEAKEEVTSIKDRLSKLNDSMAKLRTSTANEIKDAKSTLEEKVEKAERRNLKEIDSLKSTIKIKDKQILLSLDEHENEMFEKDIAIEQLLSIRGLLERKIALLEENPTTVTSRILQRFSSYWYSRKFKSLAQLA